MEKESEGNLEDQLRFEFFCKIQKQENSYLNKHPVSKVLGRESIIKTTGYLTENVSLASELPEQTILRPGYFSRIFFIVCSSLIIYNAVGHLLHSHQGVSFATISLLVLSAIFLFVNLIPYNKKQNIELNKEGINIDGQFYEWQGILETYFVDRPEKQNKFSLLIGFRNGELLRFSLDKFINLSTRKIDRIIIAIENYRQAKVVKNEDI